MFTEKQLIWHTYGVDLVGHMVVFGIPAAWTTPAWAAQAWATPAWAARAWATPAWAAQAWATPAWGHGICCWQQ